MQHRLGYRPALDGVRGIAVLLVMAAHFTNGVSPHKVGFGLPVFTGGGIIGVQLFFALSGWLITTLLLEERESSGRVDMPRFYTRRVRRLYPALIVLVVFDSMVGLAQGRPIGESSLVVLAYVANLGAITGWSAGWLGHAWTLAVEEQFYASWPWITRLRINRTLVGWVALAVAVATVAARTRVPYSQAYHLLRWDAIGLGCAAAAFGWRPRPALYAAGWVVAIAVAQPLIGTNAMLTITALAAGVIVAGSRDVKWLAHPWLIWAGRRSYGLYLWHVWWLRFGWSPWLALVLSLVTAEASWRVVERRWIGARIRARSSRRASAGRFRA